MSSDGRPKSPMMEERDEWDARVVQVGEVIEKLCDVTDDFEADVAVRLTERPSEPWQAAFRKINPPGVFKAVSFFETDTFSFAIVTVPGKSKDAIVETYRRFCNAVNHANREFAEQRKQRYNVIGAIHDAIEEINQ